MWVNISLGLECPWDHFSIIYSLLSLSYVSRMDIPSWGNIVREWHSLLPARQVWLTFQLTHWLNSFAAFHLGWNIRTLPRTCLVETTLVLTPSVPALMAQKWEPGSNHLSTQLAQEDLYCGPGAHGWIAGLYLMLATELRLVVLSVLPTKKFIFWFP